MTIEKTEKKDAQILTDLTMRSKSYWDYSAEQIMSWKDDLTITAAYIDKNEVYKLTNKDNIIIGFYSYIFLNAAVIKLDNLFIDPTYIGNGFGTLLMNDFLKRIKSLQFEKVTLDADPNAERFYHKFGFKTVGKLKSTIENRFLPIMEMKISKAVTTYESH
jgi:N-acetylglutamate synthase-like GNAT family acetyltransferase